MRFNFEKWLFDFQKKKSAALLLAIPSWSYSLAARLRNMLYDRKILRSKFSTKCVVSVGNIVAGGVGKTQVVDLLCQELANELKTTVLSRGYLSLGAKNKEPLVVRQEEKAEICGDEPLMLLGRQKQISVIVCPDRFKAARIAEHCGSELLILDDGMQHRRLFRDFEIVVLEGVDPFGRGKFLPWGKLRESPKSLKKADLIVSVGALSQENRLKIAKLSAAQCVEARICIKNVMTMDGQKIKEVLGRKAAVFCALGNPKRFVKTLEEAGLEVVSSYFLPDHRKFKKKDLSDFAGLAKNKGAEFLICSEKDKVKLANSKDPLSLPIFWIEAEMKIMSNEASWQSILNKIKYMAGTRI